jgi:stage IV sporulation protein B
VGVKLFSEGLLVVNLSEGAAACPAKESGIRTGDVLLELNHEDLKSTEQLQEALQENGDKPVSLTVKRGTKTLSLTATPAGGSDGVYRLGAWVRDSMAGIGTMTYYDPATGTFGALGHGITDVDTGQLMPIASGSLMPSTVASVNRGQKGTPGELNGDFQTERELGRLQCNAQCGIFGTLTDDSWIEGTPVPVATREEVHCGAATILSNVEGDEVEAFSVKITKFMENGEGGRDLMLRVTDKALLEKTGGIVQGMSGSPILQDGKIVGAVTHVLVSDPTRGYAILMEHMLDT